MCVREREREKKMKKRQSKVNIAKKNFSNSNVLNVLSTLNKSLFRKIISFDNNNELLKRFNHCNKSFFQKLDLSILNYSLSNLSIPSTSSTTSSSSSSPSSLNNILLFDNLEAIFVHNSYEDIKDNVLFFDSLFSPTFQEKRDIIYNVSSLIDYITDIMLIRSNFALQNTAMIISLQFLDRSIYLLHFNNGLYNGEFYNIENSYHGFIPINLDYTTRFVIYDHTLPNSFMEFRALIYENRDRLLNVNVLIVKTNLTNLTIKQLSQQHQQLLSTSTTQKDDNIVVLPYITFNQKILSLDEKNVIYQKKHQETFFWLKQRNIHYYFLFQLDPINISTPNEIRNHNNDDIDVDNNFSSLNPKIITNENYIGNDDDDEEESDDDDSSEEDLDLDFYIKDPNNINILQDDDADNITQSSSYHAVSIYKKLQKSQFQNMSFIIHYEMAIKLANLFSMPDLKKAAYFVLINSTSIIRPPIIKFYRADLSVIDIKYFKSNRSLILKTLQILTIKPEIVPPYYSFNDMKFLHVVMHETVLNLQELNISINSIHKSDYDIILAAIIESSFVFNAVFGFIDSMPILNSWSNDFPMFSKSTTSTFDTSSPSSSSSSSTTTKSIEELELKQKDVLSRFRVVIASWFAAIQIAFRHNIKSSEKLNLLLSEIAKKTIHYYNMFPYYNIPLVSTITLSKNKKKSPPPSPPPNNSVSDDDSSSSSSSSSSSETIYEFNPKFTKTNTFLGKNVFYMDYYKLDHTIFYALIYYFLDEQSNALANDLKDNFPELSEKIINKAFSNEINISIPNIFHGYYSTIYKIRNYIIDIMFNDIYKMSNFSLSSIVNLNRSLKFNSLLSFDLNNISFIHNHQNTLSQIINTFFLKFEKSSTFVLSFPLMITDEKVDKKNINVVQQLKPLSTDSLSSLLPPSSSSLLDDSSLPLSIIRNIEDIKFNLVLINNIPYVIIPKCNDEELIVNSLPSSMINLVDLVVAENPISMFGNIELDISKLPEILASQIRSNIKKRNDNNQNNSEIFEDKKTLISALARSNEESVFAKSLSKRSGKSEGKVIFDTLIFDTRRFANFAFRLFRITDDTFELSHRQKALYNTQYDFLNYFALRSYPTFPVENVPKNTILLGKLAESKAKINEIENIRNKKEKERILLKRKLKRGGEVSTIEEATRILKDREKQVRMYRPSKTEVINSKGGQEQLLLLWFMYSPFFNSSNYGNSHELIRNKNIEAFGKFDAKNLLNYYFKFLRGIYKPPPFFQISIAQAHYLEENIGNQYNINTNSFLSFFRRMYQDPFFDYMDFSQFAEKTEIHKSVVTPSSAIKKTFASFLDSFKRFSFIPHALMFPMGYRIQNNISILGGQDLIRIFEGARFKCTNISLLSLSSLFNRNYSQQNILTSLSEITTIEPDANSKIFISPLTQTFGPYIKFVWLVFQTFLTLLPYIQKKRILTGDILLSKEQNQAIQNNEIIGDIVKIIRNIIIRVKSNDNLLSFIYLPQYFNDFTSVDDLNSKIYTKFVFPYKRYFRAFANTISLLDFNIDNINELYQSNLLSSTSSTTDFNFDFNNDQSQEKLTYNDLSYQCFTIFLSLADACMRLYEIESNVKLSPSSFNNLLDKISSPSSSSTSTTSLSSSSSSTSPLSSPSSFLFSFLMDNKEEEEKRKREEEEYQYQQQILNQNENENEFKRSNLFDLEFSKNLQKSFLLDLNNVISSVRSNVKSNKDNINLNFDDDFIQSNNDNNEVLPFNPNELYQFLQVEVYNVLGNFIVKEKSTSATINNYDLISSQAFLPSPKEFYGPIVGYRWNSIPYNIYFKAHHINDQNGKNMDNDIIPSFQNEYKHQHQRHNAERPTNSMRLRVQSNDAVNDVNTNKKIIETNKYRVNGSQIYDDIVNQAIYSQLVSSIVLVQQQEINNNNPFLPPISSLSLEEDSNLLPTNISVQSEILTELKLDDNTYKWYLNTTMPISYQNSELGILAGEISTIEMAVESIDIFAYSKESDVSDISSNYYFNKFLTNTMNHIEAIFDKETLYPIDHFAWFQYIGIIDFSIIPYENSQYPENSSIYVPPSPPSSPSTLPKIDDSNYVPNFNDNDNPKHHAHVIYDNGHIEIFQTQKIFSKFNLFKLQFIIKGYEINAQTFGNKLRYVRYIPPTSSSSSSISPSTMTTNESNARFVPISRKDIAKNGDIPELHYWKLISTKDNIPKNNEILLDIPNFRSKNSIHQPLSIVEILLLSNDNQPFTILEKNQLVRQIIETNPEYISLMSTPSPFPSPSPLSSSSSSSSSSSPTSSPDLELEAPPSDFNIRIPSFLSTPTEQQQLLNNNFLPDIIFEEENEVVNDDNNDIENDENNIELSKDLFQFLSAEQRKVTTALNLKTIGDYKNLEKLFTENQQEYFKKITESVKTISPPIRGGFSEAKAKTLFIYGIKPSVEKFLSTLPTSNNDNGPNLSSSSSTTATTKNDERLRLKNENPLFSSSSSSSSSNQGQIMFDILTNFEKNPKTNQLIFSLEDRYYFANYQLKYYPVGSLWREFLFSGYVNPKLSKKTFKSDIKLASNIVSSLKVKLVPCIIGGWSQGTSMFVKSFVQANLINLTKYIYHPLPFFNPRFNK